MKNATQLNTVTKEGNIALFYFYSKLEKENNLND